MNKQVSHIPSGYKPSPLGPIPEDWEVRKLGEVCAFLRTNTLSRNQLNDMNGDIHNIHYGDVLVKYPSIIDVQKQSIPFINSEDYKESMIDFIEDGDIVLADTAEDETVGKACEIANVGSEKILSGLHTMLIRPQKGLFSPWFLGYQVNSVSYRKQLQALIQGIKVCSLGKQAIANTYFAVPPLPEQQRIVSVLSLWDTAIAKQTALIEKLTLRKRGLMQQLLTGKKRLRGFSGEWGYHKIQDHFTEIRDKNDGKGHIPMTISAKVGLVSQTHKFDRIVAGNSLDKYTLLHKGDFAYNKGNSNLYEMGCIYRLKEESAVVPFVYICFRVVDDTCCEFYQQFFINHGLDKQLKQIITSGARGDGLLNVNSEDFMALKIPYPSIDEQKIIANILNQADKEIEIHKQKLAAMQEQKKGLMQVLLSGKKRIN